MAETCRGPAGSGHPIRFIYRASTHALFSIAPAVIAEALCPELTVRAESRFRAGQQLPV